MGGGGAGEEGLSAALGAHGALGARGGSGAHRVTRDFYRCASKELRLLPILGKDPPRAEEELLGPGGDP